MVKNPGRYIFIVSGIAVGVVIFSLTFFFMFEARGKGIEAFAGHERMAEIGHFDSGSDRGFSFGIGIDLLQRAEELQLPEMEEIATFKPFGWDNYVSDASDESSSFLPYAANLLVVNSGFFNVLGLKFISGSQGDWQNNRAVIRNYLPESIPYEVESLSQIFERKAGYPKTLARVAYLIAFFALVIILFGIYAAVLTDTAKSRKSVAIRKINGATPTDIYQLFGRLYVVLITLAFILSAPLVVFVFDKTFMSIPTEFRPDNWHWVIMGFGLHYRICDVGSTSKNKEYS